MSHICADKLSACCRQESNIAAECNNRSTNVVMILYVRWFPW